MVASEILKEAIRRARRDTEGLPAPTSERMPPPLIEKSLFAWEIDELCSGLERNIAKLRTKIGSKKMSDSDVAKEEVRQLELDMENLKMLQEKLIDHLI